MAGLSKSCRDVCDSRSSLCRNVNLFTISRAGGCWHDRDAVTADRKLFAGARLRRLRLQRGVTQTRMADDLGVSVSYLNLIERNQRPLTAAFLLKLAQAYDLDLRQLTGDDGAR